MTRRWRTAGGRAAALLTAIAIACFAFIYRFNALGGSLGGFEDDHFPVLARAEMLLRGEQPLRDFADAEFRGAWPALSYEVPAWTQRILGRNLLSEARVTAGVLAICAGLVFLIARSLAGSWLIALLGAFAVLASGAELYNFPKVLALTIAAPLLMWLLAQPSAARIAVMAGWTAIAGLFRHDYAIYLALATVSGLLVRELRAPRLALRRSAAFLACLAVWLLPSAAWVQWYEGVGEYVTGLMAVSQTERATRSLHDWPAVSLSSLFSDPSLIAFLYYAFWAVPLCAAILLVVRRLHTAPARDAGPGSPGEAVGVAFVVLALVVNYFFLRSNLESRFGDAIVPVVLLAAWIAGTPYRPPFHLTRAASWLVPALVMAAMSGAMCQTNAFASELRTAGLSQSWGETSRRYADVTAALRALPPTTWTDANARGTLAAARYLAECSGPDDYVLVGAYASEIPVYARRRFAAGQGTFSLGLYSSPDDQRRAVERLRRQSAPIAFASPEFPTDYPLLWQYVASHYREAGVFEIDGEPYLHVLVDPDRAPLGTHPASGLPCFR